MSLSERWTEIQQRLPSDDAERRSWPVRWFLIDGSRTVVTCVLLLLVFGTVFAVGTVWTFEMQRLLTETEAVQTLLNTMLSGIILLVSIVASISAIVISYDITSLDTQEQRIDAAMDFRQSVGQLARSRSSPTDPASFLRLMAGVMGERADSLERASSRADTEFSEEVNEYARSVGETVEWLEHSIDDVGRGEFDALWRGLEVDYGSHLDHSRRLIVGRESQFTEEGREQFDELVQAFELFATGKEYFKTLYYSHEVSKLSRTLLLISFPAILVTASAILAIDAHLFPEVWVLGMPPLLSFVALVFTISLAPFAVLTAYMLRVATVAMRTASGGPFRIVG